MMWERCPSKEVSSEGWISYGEQEQRDHMNRVGHTVLEKRWRQFCNCRGGFGGERQQIAPTSIEMN